MNFLEWLAQKHPDVHLTPKQHQAARYWMEHGTPGFWSGGRASGRTFLAKLWSKYQEDLAEGKMQ